MANSYLVRQKVMNNIKDLFSRILVALFALSMFYMPIVQADDLPAPHALVKAATDQILQALKDNEEQLESDPDFIFNLVEQMLIPNFDFDKMAKLTLGKNWRKATADQQQQFTKQFRLLLIRTYATAMREYTDERIDFLPFHGDLAKNKVKVAMEIIQTGGPSIPMALSMYLNKEEAWKVYDVKIDGISLVTNYRSSFATRIRNNGIDKLIEDLAKKNEKVKV